MFRHRGKSRTFLHNLRLASLLSFVAGTVNISGVLAVKTLTTNVTGHFAYFAEDLVEKNYATSVLFLLFIVAFLFGAFVSNFLVEAVLRMKPRIAHTAPIITETTILSLVGIFGGQFLLADFNGQFLACALLFAMGMQNALVTKVSQSVVRTTHLTGLFTDLGIELSQLFFYRKADESQKLKKSIFLRLMIIAFFFLGCILGGFLFKIFELKTLLLGAALLIIALFYDAIRYKYHHIKRRMLSK